MRMMAEPQPAEGGELSDDDRMKQKAMEVFENIESLVSASYYEDPESPDDREDLFVMRGSFDAAKMGALLADAPGEKVEHRGIVIRKLPRHLDPPEEGQEEAAEPEPPVCLAFLGDTFAAGGAEQLVRQAIDRHLDGAEASNGGLFALGDPVPEGFQLWHIVNAKPLQAMAPPPEAASPEDGPAGLAAGMLSGLVGDMDHVRFAIQLTDGIGLRLEGLFNSPDKAKMASQAFAGLLAMAQMAGAEGGEEPQGGEGPEMPMPPAAMDILKSIEALSGDQSAGIALKVTGEQISDLMFAFMSGGMGGDEPAEAPGGQP